MITINDGYGRIRKTQIDNVEVSTIEAFNVLN